MKMEYMPTRKFLWRHVWAISCRYCRSWRISLISRGCVRECHLFTTNNASMVVHRGHFLLGSIWITLIHVSGCGTVSHKVPQTRNERPGSHVYVANHIQRNTIKRNDNCEEAKISGQLQKVFDMN